MMHKTPPFVLPAPSTIKLEPWRRDNAPLPELDEAWDPSTNLVIQRAVTIDVESLLDGALLPQGTPLALAVTWRSAPSQMGDLAARVSPIETGPMRIQAVLPGNRIGGRLAIRTTISLARDIEDARPGVAHRAGSVLFEDEASIILEGDTGRFPVTVEDFAECAWDTDASWHLTFGDDLRAPFLAACWLSINARDTQLVAAIQAAEQDDRQTAILEQTFHEVAALMIEAAELAERTLGISTEEYPPETLGAVLASFIDPNTDRSSDDVGGLPDLMTLCYDASRRSGTARRLGFGRSFA